MEYTTKSNIFSILKTSPLNSPTNNTPPCISSIEKMPVFSLLQENPKYIEKNTSKCKEMNNEYYEKHYNNQD